MFLNIPNQYFIKTRHYLKLLRLVHIMFFFLLKERSCSHKLRYEGHLELICRCFSYDICAELIYMRILNGKITYDHEKAYVMVMYVILRLEITKLFYIGNVIF
jgi:hypothetical protein